MAGIVAVMNQATGHTGGSGNINPILYPLAAHVPTALHDMTTGNNQVPFAVPCAATTQIGYAAGAGYDLATGLGSIDALVMVNNWTSVVPAGTGNAATSVDFSLAFSPTQLTVKKGACGTAQLLLTPLNGFAGTPSFSCAVSSTLGSTTCAVSAAVATSLLAPSQFSIPNWGTPVDVILILLLALGCVLTSFSTKRFLLRLQNLGRIGQDSCQF